MVKEETKNIIRDYINSTAEYIRIWGKEYKTIIRGLLGREQLYRQKFLPVEVSDIIENEIRQEILSKKWEEYDKFAAKEITSTDKEIRESMERIKREIPEKKIYEKGTLENFIWLIRLLRNEIPLTERPPKNKEALEMSERLMEREKEAIEQEEREKEWEKEQEKERIKKKVEQEIRQEAEAKEKKRQEKEQKKAEKKRLEKERNEQIKQQLKEAKEYGKAAYEWLPQKAQDWIKIILLIIVISVVIWGLKYIIRFVKFIFRGVKYVFNFLKWIWNNIVEAINEVKKVFEKEKKTEENTPAVVEILPCKKEEENETEEEL